METIIHRLDLEPGGLLLVEMRMGERSSYQHAEYTQVAAPERLAWLHSVAPSPMMPDWPRVLLTVVTFE